MRSRSLFLLPVVFGLVSGTANAGWQYDGAYVGDGWYNDNGSRFVISARGGASLGTAKIKNQVGSLTSEYYYDPSDGVVISAMQYDKNPSPQFKYAGFGELSELPADKNLSSFAFAGGASLGWTIGGHPQWRVELGWDHITEVDYNASPLFQGEMPLIGGEVEGIVIDVKSGGVQSKLSTDIISAMAFYDFFEGLRKPVNQIIPYIGLGLGYADSATKMNLADLYGDLSQSEDMHNFGTVEGDIVQFHKSETHTSNIALVGALGLSYGLTEMMFLDLGVRVAYIPQVKWALTNADDTRKRDWFSADKLVYTNVMLGIRFEF